MALINCPACGRQISDKATVCPYCGQPPVYNAAPQQMMPAQAAPASKSRTPLIIAVTVVLLALIVGAVVLVLNLNKSDDSKSTDPTSLPAANSMLVVSGAETDDTCTLNLKVEVLSNIAMAKYMVDVYLDGTLLATIDESTVYDQKFTVAKGVHTVTFKNNEQPDNAKYTCEVNETVTKDMGILYSLKRNTEKGGIIDKVTGIEIRDREYF